MNIDIITWEIDFIGSHSCAWFHAGMYRALKNIECCDHVDVSLSFLCVTHILLYSSIDDIIHKHFLVTL